ncbi:zf-TFIIB domain-containing protein [Flavobacterium sp. HSC-61S13]|uniref:TFIIB-type zinc ribbon-containing protein n=1 Tax=Flavobacterium sp. HSC-61S13 TaxID=2910963 RepID=UPI00209CB182|nr:zf-TFIIB domain-containing protein [Flavobacterium sp. HSC-61S13]MCP1996389.1 Zn-finger nucleic acid-binding protein [Flavobacterium sp. HSC-61S13]
MKCPTCNETLLMSEKNGIEIDYCPSCRGIWLDRGELDKIIERSMAQDSQSSNQNNNDYNRPHKEHYKENYQSKKKSFLSDIFDF